MWESWVEWLNGSMAAASRIQQANMRAFTQSMELATSAYARMWGQPVGQQVAPADRRFKDEAWSENMAADLLKQSYLITSAWLMEMANGWEPINPDLHRRTRFWTQQLVDASSPANFAMTNPVVMQEIARTGGMNLFQGAKNVMKDVQSGRITQVPEDAFEVGKDLAITPGKVVYRNRLIELIQYSPSTETVYAIPILVVPPWINKYYVMDMQPQDSLFKHLVDAGFTLFTISWKNPDETVLDLEWDDYLDLGTLEALRVVKEIMGVEKVNLVGYCLGGIISQVTLAYLAAVGDDGSINSATYFTTHQDFSDAGDISVFISKLDVMFLEWLMKVSGGYLDGRNMAATFNMLRANDLLWNYVVHNYLLGQEPPSFDLLYWNNDGTRVPGKVHSFLLREFFLENKLKEPGGITIKGVPIDLGKITTPAYVVAADRDHIVPWRGAFLVRQLQSGPVRFILSGGGHIAGVISPPTKNRGYLINEDELAAKLPPDPDAWLAGATRHEGSWWADWTPWLAERSGEQIAPPAAAGNEEFKPIMDAPGTYVLEK